MASAAQTLARATPGSAALVSARTSFPKAGSAGVAFAGDIAAHRHAASPFSGCDGGRTLGSAASPSARAALGRVALAGDISARSREAGALGGYGDGGGGGVVLVVVLVIKVAEAFLLASELSKINTGEKINGTTGQPRYVGKRATHPSVPISTRSRTPKGSRKTFSTSTSPPST